jgi:hypothetical protein
MGPRKGVGVERIVSRASPECLALVRQEGAASTSKSSQICGADESIIVVVAVFFSFFSSGFNILANNNTCLTSSYLHVTSPPHTVRCQITAQPAAVLRKRGDTMTFATWADDLCGYYGSLETNKELDTLGESFLSPDDALDNLRGDESTLFMGIAPDGSPLFAHHMTDLGSNRRSTDPILVAIVGLHRGTTVVQLEPVDCLGSIPKLLAAGTAEGFDACKPSKNNTASLQSLCLLPLPPFLIPCVAANTHSSLAELGAAIAAELTESALMDKGERSS